MSARAQRACLWSGLLMLSMFGVGFGALSGFITPTSPQSSPEEIARMFAEDRDSIRIGLLISMFAAALLVPWSTVVFQQLRRGESGFSPMPWVVLLSGTLFSLEFLYLLMIWQVAAYRDDWAPDTVRLLNDAAWVPFIGLVSTAVMMALAAGLSILADSRPAPLLPRWLGYFCVWAALLFTPGCVTVFVHDGPFAVNGVLAWYIPLTVFVFWMVAMTFMLLRSVGEQEREFATSGLEWVDGKPLSIEDLAKELAQVRAELAQVSVATAP